MTDQIPGAAADAAWQPLEPLEARVIGVLVEKERTVPDTYPLSLNALVAGCNQKNNRDPVIQVGEGDVTAAIDALKSRTLVIESSGARVARYTHNLGRVLRVPDQAVALLATLMLRGAQTAAELRVATERMHRFADASAVEGFLDELRERPPERGGPLVVLLPRRPGEREPRWAHLLSGPVAHAEVTGAAPVVVAAPSDGGAALRERVERLAEEVAQLRLAMERIEHQMRGTDRS
ncbi:MAG TPA: YceH family protein [Burkholderiaceae bacterium]|nr:YceH family protein [Burkholderiaceae bacterium]